jgi:ChrR Cupin-like domain
MHKQAEIEQTFVIEGSFYDHDGICRAAGEFVWRRVGSYHETHSDEGAVILAIYRKSDVFQHSSGYAPRSKLSKERHSSGGDKDVHKRRDQSHPGDEAALALAGC